jgi:hypothetical protein
MATSVNLTRWAGGLRKIWQPDQPAKGIVILHQGHSSLAGNDMNGHRFPTLDLVPLARRLVSSGYRVYGFEMPPLPHGEGQIERFYQPVIDLLDRISPQDLPIYMIGLSGGGWTTTVVTALDDRISLGFSVSGSLPEDVRPPESCEDWEQCNPPHDYRTLYAMAGDRLMQMYSLGEPGHFGGIEGDLGYAYVSDVNSNEHTITEWMEEYILGRIKDFEGAIGSS